MARVSIDASPAGLGPVRALVAWMAAASVCGGLFVATGLWLLLTAAVVLACVGYARTLGAPQ